MNPQVIIHNDGPVEVHDEETRTRPGADDGA